MHYSIITEEQFNKLPENVRGHAKRYGKRYMVPSNYVKPESAQVSGLGDVVAKIAKPIARIIDKVAGTKLKTCGGCAQRQRALNKMFPFKKTK
jgi:hypothetical protein